MIATVSLRRMWLREVVEGILFRNRSDSLFLKHDENNNDRILKRMTIQSMRGRADWSYWRIDDWKQWSLAFVFWNTIILWNTCNEGQIGKPHSPRWIAQWTEWLCSCPSPIPTDRMSVLQYTYWRWQVCSWIDFTSSIGMVLSKEETTTVNKQSLVTMHQTE